MKKGSKKHRKIYEHITKIDPFKPGINNGPDMEIHKDGSIYFEDTKTHEMIFVGLKDDLLHDISKGIKFNLLSLI